MPFWTKGLMTQLRMTGKSCQAQIDEAEVSFPGIYDEQSQIEDVQGRQLVVLNSSLVVHRHIAKKVRRGDQLIVEDEQWFVRDILYETDGELGRLLIVRDLNDLNRDN
jgi:hypothetical protein